MIKNRSSLVFLCLGMLLMASAPMAAGGGEIGPASVWSLQGLTLPGGEAELLPTWSSALSFPAGEGRVRYAWAQCPSMPNSVFIFSGVNEAAPRPTPRGGSTRTRTHGIPSTRSPTRWRVRLRSAGRTRSSSSAAAQRTNTSSMTLRETAGVRGPHCLASCGAPRWRCLNGSIYMVGGDSDFSFGGTSNEVNIYDIATDTWIGTGSP